MVSHTVITSSDAKSIEPEQTLKASRALLAHIKKATKQKAEVSIKKSLLDDDDNSATLSETPIWLTLTTKRHITDASRLKPARILLPHSLNAHENIRICLITADPQRAYKNIVASDEFPADLRKCISRVIGYTKLKAKFGQYEAQRKLFAEHDVFLGDDRIINRLPKALGKTFYKTTAKRPIPVSFRAPSKRGPDGKRIAQSKKDGDHESINAASPAIIASEITKAMGSALVNLSPSTSTSIRVGCAAWAPELVAQNVEAVVSALVEKHIPQKWKNVKGIYIKGPETVALPIYLADQLWMDEKDVVANQDAFHAAIEDVKSAVSKKRKSISATAQADEPEPATKKTKKNEEKPASNDDNLNKQIAARQEKLRKQKAAASKALDN